MNGGIKMIEDKKLVFSVEKEGKYLWEGTLVNGWDFIFRMEPSHIDGAFFHANHEESKTVKLALRQIFVEYGKGGVGDWNSDYFIRPFTVQFTEMDGEYWILTEEESEIALEKSLSMLILEGLKTTFNEDE